MWKYISVPVSIGLAYLFYQKYKNLINIFANQKECNEAEVYDSYIVIPYKYHNHEYTVRLPFDVSKIFTMTNYLVHAVTNDKEEDITQQPGVPYFISSLDLNCDNIVVSDLNEEVERTFYTKPYYGE